MKGVRASYSWRPRMFTKSWNVTWRRWRHKVSRRETQSNLHFVWHDSTNPFFSICITRKNKKTSGCVQVCTLRHPTNDNTDNLACRLQISEMPFVLTNGKEWMFGVVSSVPEKSRCFYTSKLNFHGREKTLLTVLYIWVSNRTSHYRLGLEVFLQTTRSTADLLNILIAYAEIIYIGQQLLSDVVQ